MNLFSQKATLFLLFILVISIGHALASLYPKSTDSLPLHPLSYLALGDSYTIGQSVDPAKRFPEQTIQELALQGIDIGKPTYLARTGWTSMNLLEAIKTSPLANRYEIISILIGVNDQYQGLDTAAYRQRFSLLLEKAIQLTGSQPKHVYVLSIPDYSVTPFGKNSRVIHEEIASFNRINYQVSMLYGVVYTDITPTSLKALSNQQFTANDGLHPSGDQYREWSALLAISLRNHLGK